MANCAVYMLITNTGIFLTPFSLQTSIYKFSHNYFLRVIEIVIVVYICNPNIGEI